MWSDPALTTKTLQRQPDTSKRRRGCSAHLHRHHQCGTVDWSHRLWTRTGTQSAKPCTEASRERSGRRVVPQVCGKTSGAVHICHPSASHRAAILWWDKDLQNLAMSLDEALQVAAGGDRADSSAAGGCRS